MNGRHLVGWVLAASVLVGVPGGILVPPSPPAQAQINPVLRGQKFLLWAVWLTRDESYAVAEQLYRDGFETWGRQDVTARLNPQQKESIRIFQMFAESNQRLLQASQQSTTALKNEQKAFERLWQRYQGWLNRTEADLEQARGIPLFAGTAGVPKLQKLLVVGGRVELAQRNAPTQGSGSPQVGAVSPRNVTPTPASQTSERRKVPTTVGQSPQPLLAQRNQGDNVEALFQRASELTQQGKYAEAEPLYQRALAILNQALTELSPQQRQAIRRQVQGLVALAGINKGLLLASQGRHGEAKQMFQESLGVLEQALGRNHPDVIKMRQAFTTYAQQQQQARQTTPQVSPQRPTGQSFALQEADRLNELGMEQYRKAQYAQALESFQRSLAIWEQALGANHPNVATALNNLAGLYHSQGQYSKAEPLYQRSLAIREQALGANHPDVATSLNNLAELYRSQGQYSKAEPLVQRSLAIYEQALGANHPDVALSLNNFALLYQAQGQYSKAEPLYQRSLAIREQALGANHPDVALSLNNLALLYHSQGQYSKAEPLYQRSLAIREQALGANHPDVAQSLNNLAVLYVNQGQYSKAEPLYQRSLAIREQALGANHPDVAVSLNNLAELYRSQGQYSKAEPLYQRSLAIWEQALGANHPNVAQSLNNLANLYRSQGQYSKAEPLVQRSLAIREQALGANHPDVAFSLNTLAVLYWSQNQTEPALIRLARALDIEETNLAQNLVIGSEADKRAYLKTFSGSTNRVISFHLQSVPNNPQAARLALTTILRRKGRVLDTLSQSLIRLRQQLSPADQERLTRLSALRAQAAQIAFNPNPTDQQRQQFQLLNAQAEQIETELNRSSAAFAQTTQKVTLEAVQKAIPQNAALVEFIQYEPFNPKALPGQRWGSPRYAVYILTSTGEPRFADLGSASEIDALVNQYYNVIRDPRLPREPLRNLDAKIMAPVRQLVGSATHLLIAPDGQLNLVSFAALVDEKNQYLIERYQITYLTSGRDLLRLQNTPPKANPPLIVANPTFDKPGSNPVQIASADRGNPRSIDLATMKFGSLPGTAIEGETIAKLLPNSRLFTQAQATETVVKSSNNPRILHLATHGFFLKSTPTNQAQDGSRNLPNENPLLRSGLAFSGFNVRQGGGDDGVLTALEITGMDLRGTQLVVLSACETGLGDVQSGEGVYGLRRAFTLAGAQSQVMSLWRVDDNATKDLMVNYYQRLSKGEGRGEALRQAQLTMLRSPNYAHPKYWSGMIPAGDWRGMSP